jgi:hypothetical protein
VERVIGRRCALQCINTDLVQPQDTRHVDLWAWTADPGAIPKRVWLVFTHRPCDRSSAVLVLREQPDRWLQGVRYEVFLHVGLLRTTRRRRMTSTGQPPTRRPSSQPSAPTSGAMASWMVLRRPRAFPSLHMIRPPPMRGALRPGLTSWLRAPGNGPSLAMSRTALPLTVTGGGLLLRNAAGAVATRRNTMGAIGTRPSGAGPRPN